MLALGLARYLLVVGLSLDPRRRPGLGVELRRGHLELFYHHRGTLGLGAPDLVASDLATAAMA